MARRIYAFLKSYGYHAYRHGYYKPELFLSVIAQGGDHEAKILAEARTDSIFTGWQNGDLGEQILAILRKNPERLSKRDLETRLQISAKELEWHCAPLIKQGLLIEVKRPNTIGRP